MFMDFTAVLILTEWDSVKPCTVVVILLWNLLLFVHHVHVEFLKLFLCALVCAITVVKVPFVDLCFLYSAF